MGMILINGWREEEKTTKKEIEAAYREADAMIDSMLVEEYAQKARRMEKDVSEVRDRLKRLSGVLIKLSLQLPSDTPYDWAEQDTAKLDSVIQELWSIGR